MKPLPGQKELPLVIDRRIVVCAGDLGNAVTSICDSDSKGKQLARLFLKYDDKPTSEMWIEILRLSRELAK